MDKYADLRKDISPEKHEEYADLVIEEIESRWADEIGEGAHFHLK